MFCAVFGIRVSGWDQRNECLANVGGEAGYTRTLPQHFPRRYRYTGFALLFQHDRGYFDIDVSGNSVPSCPSREKIIWKKIPKIAYSEPLKWGLILLGIFLLNIFLSNTFMRWDLTKEKRYSLSPLSKETVENLEAPLWVTSYIEGEFPVQIRRFQEAVNTTLIELDQYASERVYIEHIDPTADFSGRDTLQKYGFQPVQIEVLDAGERVEKDLYSVVKLAYQDKDGYWRETFLDLFENCLLPNGQINLEKAEADLEYQLVSRIRRLKEDDPITVALLQGQGEYTLQELPPDLFSGLANNYNFLFGNIIPGQGLDEQIDILLILQPTQPFSEREKYELDQYLMRGGRIIWIMDFQKVDLSVFENRSTVSEIYDLNLDDLFFRYGIKLNSDLIPGPQFGAD